VVVRRAKRLPLPLCGKTLRDNMTNFNIYENLIKELLAEGEAAAASSTEVIFNPEMTDLKMKSLGNDVKAWQWALVALDYNLGEFGKKGDGVDGKFGLETDRATREFQTDYRTAVDGIVGDRTLTLMNAVLAKKGIKEIPGYKKSKVPVKKPPQSTQPDADAITREKKKGKKKSKGVIPNIANAKIVHQGIKQLGFNDIQAAAWIGTIAGESGFVPYAHNPDEGKPGNKFSSYGICQWNQERFAHLQRFSKQQTGDKNGWRKDLNLQVEFIGEELKLPYYNKLVVVPLKEAEDNLEKSLWILIKFYENPKNAEADYKRRLPIARAALEEFSEKSAEADQDVNTASLDTSDDTIPTSLAENIELDRIKHLSKVLLG
jgi:peptidoglycan hydrolase-like protein with peptidoglycan-binding domain